MSDVLSVVALWVVESVVRGLALDSWYTAPGIVVADAPETGHTVV